MANNESELLNLINENPSDEDLLEAFNLWNEQLGIDLYDHQSESFLEILAGNHLILATPTGSGKSLVATSAHFVALAKGQRSFYTAPIKALVSEKFFALVKVFGSHNVGMMTGDTSVNAGAPIICCTAEILANIALRQGPSAKVDQVIMDEFHFYADPQRGWAWQVPLLELKQAQFVLMSATLGDTQRFVTDLKERTGKDVALVTNTHRPVPLNFTYQIQPLAELTAELLSTHRAPVYLVHFTQRDATECAKSLLGLNLVTRSQKDRIAEELGDFSFGSGFGKQLSKLLRNGIGIHHAGLLPKYRRLVEKLTQKGVLPVVCGTDTLGVGINVPIRSVVLTTVVKYDGTKMRHLSVREFLQVAGRAGRAGYDTIGDVFVLAPEHVIENRKLLEKAGDDPKKLKKITRKKAPVGAVNWTEQTFERLTTSPPEELTSTFQISHAMAINVLARADQGDLPKDQKPLATMRRLLLENHESTTNQRKHIRQAFRIYRSLRQAGVVEKYRDEDGIQLRLTVDLPDHFALNQPLSPFALAAQELLNPQDPQHSLDLISVIEATLENPLAVLIGQEKVAKAKAMAEFRNQGLGYDERIAQLAEITWPMPGAEWIKPAFETYRQTNPWLLGYEVNCKSIVRDMLENAMSFQDFISRYALTRSEGVLLRYLSDAYRALKQTVSGEHLTPELQDIIDWLGQLIVGVDSSLISEWEQLSGQENSFIGEVENHLTVPTLQAFTANKNMLRILIRNAMFQRVERVAQEDYDALGALDGPSGWDAERWAEALDDFFVAYGDDGLEIAGDARSPKYCQITEGDQEWKIRQVLVDIDHDLSWAISARVDLAACDAAQQLVLQIENVAELEPFE